jgi:branched-chain amino acid transport system permease protein
MLSRAIKTLLAAPDMDYGTSLLSTLLIMTVAVIVYRVVVLVYRRVTSGRRDVSIVEQNVREWWRIGAAIILLAGIALMFGLLFLSGVDLLSPINDSIQLGIIYAIMGIGLTLTYSVVKIPNFAHGEMATIGAYTMALSNTWWGVPIPLAFAAAAGAGAVLGLLQHLIVYRPLINRRAKIVQIMIASFAVSLIIRAIFWMFAAYENVTQYKPLTYSVLTQISIPFTQITLYDCHGFCRVGNSAVTDLFFAVVLTSIPLVVLLHLLLTRTLIGKSMRAVADNVELAQITGINVEYIRQVTWILTGALAGLGGAFLGIDFTIWPELGWTSLLRVFAAVTIGGLVSFYGTIAGGLIVGLGEIWVTDVAANFGLSTSFQPVTVFLIIALVLLIRPTGLSGLIKFRGKRPEPPSQEKPPANSKGS